MKLIKKDFLALFVIPIEFILLDLIGHLSFLKGKEDILQIISVVIYVISFALLIALYKKELKIQWLSFKKGILKKILLSLLLVIGLHGLLFLVRIILNSTSVPMSGTIQSTARLVIMPLLASLPATLSPFSEEIVFRYILIGKSTKMTSKALLLLVSSVVFGLLHINNFGGDVIQTIPYMFMGLFFGVIYLWGGKNIWWPITVHFLFNLPNSIFATLLFQLIQFIFIR